MSSFQSFLQQLPNSGVGDVPLSLEAGFMPFTLDVAPLQRFLLHLAHQVEQGQKERDALRNEVHELKVERRLEALEQGLADLADSVQRHQALPLTDPDRQYSSQATGGHTRQSDVVDLPGGWDAELAQLKERLELLERKSEALWRVQENEEQLRGAIERLRTDADGTREQAGQTLVLARAAQLAAERLDTGQRQAVEAIEKLQEKANHQEILTNAAREERQEMVSNWETTQSQFWDQIRNVEATLSQRLATSETSVVSALQEVDEMKEISAELMQRVDEAKRHMGALEGKLESFNTQVAAAISPLHTSIAAVNTRMAELAGTKLDISQAITEEDVNRAAARAVDHADRRCDGIIKSVAGVEARVEHLTNNKADRNEVVLLTDMTRILDQHDSGMDGRLAAMRAGIMAVVDTKADKEELSAVNGQLGARLAGLEQAILKGLKAISDKVSAALSEKLALTAFNEFKVQVRAVLADLEDRLRDWSPTALATKSVAGMDGGGATTCLFCDNRVKSVKDLRALGFSLDDKVFSPERLPTVESWHPGAANVPGLGAHVSAKVLPGTRKTSGGSRVSESLPAVPGALDASMQAGVTSLDMSVVQLPDGSPGKASGSGRYTKVDVETISGSIAQGRIPNTRGKQAPRSQNKTGKLPNIEPSEQRSPSISGWMVEPPPPALHITSNGLEG